MEGGVNSKIPVEVLKTNVACEARTNAILERPNHHLPERHHNKTLTCKLNKRIEMILPILSHGHSILRKVCDEIDQNYPELEKLISDMWETMEGASGCGLAGPQVNRLIKLFIVDSETTYEFMNESDRKEYYDGDTGIKETFINAKILNNSEKEWSDDEGCLSIPNHSEKVTRPWTIEIEYFDRKFKKHRKKFSGNTARMIQHEFDHIGGILYLDYLSNFKRKLIKSKLERISKGKLPAKYPMKYIK